ncbi:MAG: hypothetical protein JSR82_01445 [Verrucomicrobia bacterium]|nr:hypothetical protein [Verrucomicrobiota bacterium]
MRRFFYLCALLGILLPQLPAAEESVAQLLQKGDEADKKWKTTEALQFFLAAEKQEPNNPEVLRRIAAQYALAMGDVGSSAEKRVIGEKALGYARRAVEMAPRDGKVQVVMAVCCGRLAKHLPNKEKIQTSKLVRQHAELAIQLAPRSDLAHYVLGVWHYEIANLNAVLKVIAGMVYGSLPPASNEDAEKHFRKARELDPGRVATVLELGRTVALNKARKDEARILFETALKMPTRDKDDPEMKKRAKAALDAL